MVVPEVYAVVEVIELSPELSPVDDGDRLDSVSCDIVGLCIRLWFAFINRKGEVTSELLDTICSIFN